MALHHRQDAFFSDLHRRLPSHSRDGRRSLPLPIHQNHRPRLLNHGFNFSPIEYSVQANHPLAWTLYKLYLPLAAIIALAVLFCVWNKPVLNQVFALCCITLVLPLVAGDYTLILLLVPMGFFLLFLLQDVASGKLPMSVGQILCFLLPCACIMATEPMLTLHGVFKCIALLALLAASIAIPLPSTLFGERYA